MSIRSLRRDLCRLLASGTGTGRPGVLKKYDHVPVAAATDVARSRDRSRRRTSFYAPWRIHSPILVETLEQRFAPSVDVLNSVLSPSPTWFGSSTISSTADADSSANQQIEQITWKGDKTNVVTDQWIVQLRTDLLGDVSSVSDAAALLKHSKVSFELMYGLGEPGELLIQTSNATVHAIKQWLGHDPSVAYFEPNQVGTTDAIPNDPSFSLLWGLNNTGQTGGTSDADIDAPEAWDVTTGSSSIVVGVIDTGVDYTHPDLAANIWTNPGEIPGNGIDDDGNGFVDDVHGYDFVNNDGNPMDDNGHGTHVSGTIAGVGNNGVGVTGVNWSCSIMALKFLDANGSGTSANAVRALNYATMMRTTYGVNIRLTSNSWGGGGYDQALYNAIAASGQAGMLFIAAAGNDSSNNNVRPFYPASYDLDNIISVAATDNNDALARFSNYGKTSVDLAAPGVNIYSTLPVGGSSLGKNYGYLSGTSMATPHVSGVAALAWSIDPSATYAEIRDAIFAGVDTKTSLSGKMVTGGRLNALGTLKQLVGISGISGISIDNVTIAEGNSGSTNFVFTVSLSPSNSKTVTVDFATADGTATTADNDYTATSGNLSFSPGETTKTITVNVIGDTKIEPNETFFVNLSGPTNATLVDGQGVGTILNDDNSPLPSISINDVSKAEGNNGQTSFIFTISLNTASTQTITVKFATANGTATTADNDYVATSGTLIFTPGQTSKPVTVLVIGDKKAEPNEIFFVNLSNASNATIADNKGLGTILNDDARTPRFGMSPTISVSTTSLTQVDHSASITASQTTSALMNDASASPIVPALNDFNGDGIANLVTALSDGTKFIPRNAGFSSLPSNQVAAGTVNHGAGNSLIALAISDLYEII